MTPYLIYGADISPYMQRLTVQLDIKGLAYRVMPPPGGLHSDTFRAISPIGKIPVLQAGDFILPESEVICDYIEDRHPEPALRPATPEDRARTRLIARIVDLYVMGPMTPLFGQLRRSGRAPAIVDPAIAAIWPTLRSESIVLDVGATIGADASQLVEFAVMGDAFARAVLGLTHPSIGLLNVGSEELKGDDRVRAAAETLRDSHIGANFRGFVEGHDITAGTTDVIVTDGFTGNVALKTGEGALKLMRDLLRQVFTSSVPARLGYLLARPALDRLREWMDPRRYNGAILIGLNGVVVKSHGGTDAIGFAHAVDVAMDMVTHGFNERIREGLSRLSTNGPRVAADSP